MKYHSKKLFLGRLLKTFCLLISTARHVARWKHEVELWKMDSHLVGHLLSLS